MSNKQRGALLGPALIGGVCLLLFGGCRQTDIPAKFTLTVPEPNVIAFEAEITRRLGLGLQGEFPIPNYGTLYFLPESSEGYFRFGFRLNRAVFEKQSWTNVDEVSTLPNGGAFPQWWVPPVVDVQIPPLNTPFAQWHFYFGTQGQLDVGAASVIPAINGNFPSLDIGYTFYDEKGRAVVGIMFFGPLVENGVLKSPGGIFVGTNLTPFLEDLIPPGDSQQGELGQVLALASDRGSVLRGGSVVSYLVLDGPERRYYRASRKVRNLVNRYLAETRK